MRKCTISIALVLMQLCVCSLHGGVDTDANEDVIGSKIKFEVVEGLIMVQAAVNGVDGNYIFDTGASGLFINREVRSVSASFWTAHGDINGEELQLDLFKYGNVERTSVVAWAMNLSFVEDIIDRPVAGIIGTDLTSDYKVIIDYELEELVLMPIGESSVVFDPRDYHISSLPFELTSDNLAIVEIGVGSATKKMAFDTGAAISVLGYDNGSQADESTISNQDIHINQVSVAQVQFVNSDAKSLRDTVSHDVDGILSVSALDPAKVIIDYASERIHLLWNK